MSVTIYMNNLRHMLGRYDLYLAVWATDKLGALWLGVAHIAFHSMNFTCSHTTARLYIT